MPRYLLLLHDRTTQNRDLSPEDIQAIIAEYQAWSQKMRDQGSLLGAEKLSDDGGRVLAGWGDGFSATDGPLAESKEVIGGVFEMRAETYDEAAALARDCPHLKFGGRIELREIDEV